jgi:formate dehydrogenase maturation protein FdhE
LFSGVDTNRMKCGAEMPTLFFMNPERLYTALRAAQADDETGLFRFYEKLLRLREAHKVTLKPFTLPAPGAGHFARPTPRLTWSALEIQPSWFHQWLAELAHLWDERDPGAGEEIQGLTSGELAAAAVTWFLEGTSGLGSVIDALLSNGLAPYLEKAATALREGLPANWREPYCPVCGGWPDMATFHDRKSRYRCICERCATEWTITCDGCLFCGESDGELLGFYSSEDELYRVIVCDTCGYYLKVVNERAAARVKYRPVLTVERLLTPGLDLTAAQEGYSRPELLVHSARDSSGE